MSTEFSEVIKQGGGTMELGVLDPTTGLGVIASVSTIGTSIDNKQWVKVDTEPTDWRPFLTGEADGTFSANIELADVSEVVPPLNVLGVNKGNLTLGDGDTQGGIEIVSASTALEFNYQHTFSDSELEGALKLEDMTAGMTNVTVAVGGGATHIKGLRWDGSGWGTPVVASGGTSIKDALGADPIAPFNSRMQKFIAVMACDAAGDALGGITGLTLADDTKKFEVLNPTLLSSLYTYYCPITSIDLSLYPALTLVNIRGLFLESLKLGNWQLEDFSLTGSSVQTLDFSKLNPAVLSTVDVASSSVTEVLLPDFTALDTVRVRYCDLVTTVELSGCNNISDKIEITGCPILETINLPAAGVINSFEIASNGVTTIDMTGITEITGYAAFRIINNPQLTSITGIEFLPTFNAGGYPIDLYNNALTEAALNQIYTELPALSATLNVSGNPGAAASNIQIAIDKGWTILI